MASGKEDALNRGVLIFEEIEADAKFGDRIDLARHGSRGYRPGKVHNRPSLSERPSTPGKARRTAEQLKLDLRAAHLAVLVQSRPQRQRAISTTSSVQSRP